MRTVEVRALIVRSDGKFLMLKRAGKWEVPAAIMEGKSSTMTLIEVVKKSCGMKVDIIKPVKLSSYRDKGKQIFTITYYCRYKSGKIKLGKDYSAFKWAGSKVKNEEKEDYMQVGK